MCVFWPPFVHAWYLSFWPDPAGPGASLWVRHSLRMVVGDEVTKGIGKVVQQLHGVDRRVSVRWWWTRCTRSRRSSPRSGRTGICIRFWCRNNPSFRLNGLVQLCLWQCFYTCAYSFDQIATKDTPSLKQGQPDSEWPVCKKWFFIRDSLRLSVSQQSFIFNR